MIRNILVVLTLTVTIVAQAQKSNASPYSFFGIGDSNSSNTVEQLSMGGAGVAYSDFYRLNMSNPASLASLQFTSYGLALENKNIWAKDNNDKQSAASTYLSYLSMAVPIGEKGGLSFGLLPNTSVGYSLLSSTLGSDGEVDELTLYEGTGGSNKVYFALGYRLFKGFNLGVQGNYIFGKVENSVIHQVRDVSLATKYETIANLKGFSLNAGFQYLTKTKNNLNLYAGASFELENELESDGNEYLYSVDASALTSPRDTLLNNESVGFLKTPLKSTFGIGVGKDNKWYAGADISMRKAIDIDGNVFNSFSKVKYDDFRRISIGGYYVPDFNSITSYWERIIYRAGIKFEKTGLTVNPSGSGSNFMAIDDFGISFGVGLPLAGQLSNLNIGFELGKRGKVTDGLVQENYINFRLSLSLADRWFVKREIF